MNVVALHAQPDSGERLRPPSQVMRLPRLSAGPPSRLSFVRGLMRRVMSENWTVRQERFDLDAEGTGVAVYVIELPTADVSLVAYSHKAPGSVGGDVRDRLIAADTPMPEPMRQEDFAGHWDATFALVEGVPDADMLERLAQNVPRQEKGRFKPTDLVLTRGLYNGDRIEDIANMLASGRQPSLGMMEAGVSGIETFSVFGNGKFGLAGFERVCRIPGLRAPFQAELLALYAIREFTLDLIGHRASALASLKGVQAATFDIACMRLFGVGNLTDSGMAPFVIEHPLVIHHWIVARERAIARVRGVRKVEEAQAAHFMRLLSETIDNFSQPRAGQVQSKKNEVVAAELASLLGKLQKNTLWWKSEKAWEPLFDCLEDTVSIRTQEIVYTLVLEPYPDLVDSLFQTMYGEEVQDLDPLMRVDILLELIDRYYAWALAIDFSDPSAQARVWRLRAGLLGHELVTRDQEGAGELEARLGIARDVVRLHGALKLFQKRGEDDAAVIASFLRDRPDFRGTVRRVQLCARYPYSEIRENALQNDLRIPEILRFTLSTLGAEKIEDINDHVVMSVLFAGAPTSQDLIENRDSTENLGGLRVPFA